MPNTSDLLSKVQQANLYFANLMNEYVNSFVFSMERDEKINAKVNDLYELLEAMDFQLAKDLYYDNENTKLIYQKIDCITPIYNTYITIDVTLIKPFISNTIQSQAVWGAITGDINNQQDLIGLLSLKQNNITLTTTGTSGAATLTGATLNIPNYGSALSGYVPYTGATGPVNLGAYDLTVNGLKVGIGAGNQFTNTLVGNSSLQLNTTGGYNSAFGFGALNANVTGFGNTAIGSISLYSNQVGFANTAVGDQSMRFNIGGQQNTAVGNNSLYANTYGDLNTAIGDHAMESNIDGGLNTALGVFAGANVIGSGGNTSSERGVYIGHFTTSSAPNNTNEIVIGASAIGNGSNTVTIGDATITDNYFKGNIRGGAFIKTGGLSTQFLKADGSVDSTAYGTGSVTSVAALTLGTTGTDLSSTVANSTTTPVITLNVPTASATNRGALSSADWTTFNSKQDAGNYITSLTGEATASGPGAASVTLSNTAVIGKVLTGLNVTGGTVASTDSILQAFGKVQNQINGLIGGSIFQGVWDASTNTPALASGVGTNGYYYIVSVDGSTNLDGITDWKVGDWAIFAGTTWEKVDNTDAVSSVNGYTGTVSLVTGDVLEGAGTLPSRPSQLYFTNARARTAISLTTSGSSGASTYDNITGILNVPTYTDQFTGTVTSVGLTMPVAFSVANSPITSAGTLEVTAIGTASQYIRGDGTLATIPSTSSGGSSFNYYLNGSVAASVGGYYQMDNTAIIGAGTDFNLTGNGLIAQFLTDAGNPNRLLLPGGAWNFEMHFNISSSGGNTKFYVELLKYNGTTFTTIANSSVVAEQITGGTVTDLYLTSLAVPETVLLITDRLAVRVYIVDNSGGRTVTLHTEDNTLCEVITTFAGGISALNGLTANTQYFATGTSGSNFNISSSLDTHTFNLPNASSINRGAITSSDWIAFNAKQNAITLTTTGSSGAATLIGATLNIPNYGNALSDYVTLATTQTITGQKTFSSNILANNFLYVREQNASTLLTNYTQIQANSTFFGFSNGAGTGSAIFTYNGAFNYILPNTTGTLALTSNITSAISGTTNYIPKFTGANTIGNSAIYDNGGNIGIGIINPLAKLNVKASSTTGSIIEALVLDGGGVAAEDGVSIGFTGFNTSAYPNWRYAQISGIYEQIDSFKGALVFKTSNASADGGTEKMRLTSSGNLGLGVTPSAWNTITAFEVSGGASFGGYSNTTYIGNNIYYQGATKYISNGFASWYYQTIGSHFWLTAPNNTSGAGATITFTQAMTLGANGILSLPSSGSLEIGYTSSPSLYKLDVNGSGRFVGDLRVTTGNKIYFETSGTGNSLYREPSNGNTVLTSAADTQFTNNNATITYLRLASSTGAATFSSSVRSNSHIIVSDGSASVVLQGYINNALRIAASGSGSSGGARGNLYVGAIDSEGAATFSGPTVTIGQATAATNVKILLNGVANKAAAIEFQQNGTPQWYLGNGAASEDNNFELYNSNGTMAMKIIKSTNAINFTGAATFSNDVSIGYTSSPSLYKLDVNGTGRFTDSLMSSKSSGRSFGNDSYGTNFGWIAMYGTTQGIQLGFEGVTGGQLINDAPANSGVLIGKVGLAISGNNGATRHLNIASTGAATFSSSVEARKLYVSPAGGAGSGSDAIANIQTTSSTLGETSELGLLIKNNGTSGYYSQIGFGYAESKVGAVIAGLITNSGGSTSSALVFGTRSTTVGSDAPVERMRITSGGNVLIGCQSLPSSTVAGFIISGTSSGNASSSGVLTSAYNHLLFYNGNGIVGSVSTSGTATSYTTSSDYRLKQDLKDYNAIDLISKIKSYDYEWKCDNTRAYGVVAHELQEIIPQAVTGEKDAENMQGVDYSKLVPILVKAIQELKAEIDILKNK